MRKQVWVSALILLVALLCWRFYHDFRLDLTTKITKLPDVVIHDVKVDKMINGRRWRISAPTVKTQDNVIYGYNVNLIITEDDGTESHVVAKEATFSKDYNQLTFSNAKGDMISGKKNYTLETGKAEYNTKAEFWNLSGKLMLTDHEMTVTGDSGTFDSVKGDCRVKGGGKISWKDD